jgi:hypothetical protein
MFCWKFNHDIKPTAGGDLVDTKYSMEQTTVMDLEDLPEVNYFRQIALEIIERATN